MRAIYDDLSLVLEIHRDAIADDGLDLPDPPFGPLWMAHQHSRF